MIIQENLHLTDPALTQARISMQVPFYPNDAPAAWCIDAKSVSFAHMAYVVLLCMYKSWVGTIKWTSVKYELNVPACFQNGSRCDVHGHRSTLCEIDPETRISGDVSDEEILAYARGLNDASVLEGNILGPEIPNQSIDLQAHARCSTNWHAEGGIQPENLS